MKAERPEKHTKIASGGLLGGSRGALGPAGARRGSKLFPSIAFWSIFGRPGGFREPSGELLGSLWALLALLLALPGVPFRVSGAVAATIGQEA